MTPTAAIHVAKKQLGLDDDTYRALLVRVAGKPSSKDMTPAEQNAVLDEMRRQGFRPASGTVRFKGSRKGLEGRFVRKLQAMWIAAWNLGVVEDRRDSALIEFVKRQTHVDHIRFLHDPAEADKVIECVSAWNKDPVSGVIGVQKGPL
jgi:phage gp16-like protein